jgi:hypothetical protein
LKLETFHVSWKYEKSPVFILTHFLRRNGVHFGWKRLKRRVAQQDRAEKEPGAAVSAVVSGAQARGGQTILCGPHAGELFRAVAGLSSPYLGATETGKIPSAAREFGPLPRRRALNRLCGRWL